MDFDIKNLNYGKFINFDFSRTINLLLAISAGEIGLFDYLEKFEKKYVNVENIIQDLKIVVPLRCFCDFLDKLYVNGFLEREGLFEKSQYRNSEFSAKKFVGWKEGNIIFDLFDKKNDVKNLLNFSKFLTEKKEEKEDFFDIVHNEETSHEFYTNMNTYQEENFKKILEKIDFSYYKSTLDIGGANGFFSYLMKSKNPHLHCMNFDLKENVKIAKKLQQEKNVAEDFFEIIPGDFFVDDFPKASYMIGFTKKKFF